MDNLTHSLFALTLGRTPLGRAGRGATAALLIASNIPDIDIIATARSSASYLQWHRGPTHGPLSIIALGVPAAGLAWLWTRFQERRQHKPSPEPAAPFAMLVALSMLGVALHLLMDFPTSYGTRLLSPFDWHWFALDWMPIIDVYLLAALAFGLLMGGATAESRRRAAIVVFTIMAANYAVRASAHHAAIAFAPQVIGTVPARCAPTEAPTLSPEMWPRAEESAPGGSGRCLVGIAAMPTFVSPAVWRVITQLSDGYEVHEINLLDVAFHTYAKSEPRVRLYFPNDWTPEVRKASESSLGQIYLGFSRFPAARSFVDNTGAATVHWSDMRFVGGLLTLGQPPRREAFAAVIKLDKGGNVVDQQFGP